MKIIGFGHRKRVGKDTASNFLMTHIKLGAKRVRVVKGNFASKLKEVSCQLYGWAGLKEESFYNSPEGEKLREVKLEGLNLTPREIWIAVGNKMRDVHQGTWIDYVLHTTVADILIVPDVRYPNEVEAIKSLGGKIYKIVNDNVERTDDIADCALEGFDGWDGIILNNSNLHTLDEYIRFAIAEPIIKEWNESKRSS